jgi:hypothetical protein
VLKNKTVVFLAIAGAAALLFLPKLQLGKKAKFYFKGIAMKGSKVLAKIAVQNPTNASAKLISLAGELYANNKLISNISSFEPKTILPNQETVLEFEFNPSVLGLVDLVRSTINNIFKLKDQRKKVGLNLKFNGTANIDGFPLPVNIEYSL